MSHVHLRADVSNIASLSGILSNLFQRVSIPLGVGTVEWRDLFNEYLETTYSDPRKRSVQKTNIPRGIWDNTDMTWEMFLIAIDILQPVKAYLTIDVKQQDGSIVTSTDYDLVNRPTFDKKGQVIKRIKDDERLYPWEGKYDAVTTYPTLMLRDYLALRKVLWSEFDVFVENELKRLPEEEQTTSARARIRGYILRSGLSWKTLINAFEILNVAKINFTLTVEMTETRKASAALLWTFLRD